MDFLGTDCGFLRTEMNCPEGFCAPSWPSWKSRVGGASLPRHPSLAPEADQAAVGGRQVEPAGRDRHSVEGREARQTLLRQRAAVRRRENHQDRALASLEGGERVLRVNDIGRAGDDQLIAGQDHCSDPDGNEALPSGRLHSDEARALLHADSAAAVLVLVGLRREPFQIGFPLATRRDTLSVLR